MHVRFAHVAVLLALGTAALAQERPPRETLTATIQGKKVSIEYGRPALKGRSFDDLIKQLPEDRIWRAGVDQVTTLTTETDLIIAGKKVPAGKYSLYVHCPEEGSYSLVLNKDLGIPLAKIWAAAPASVASEPWPRLDGYQRNVGDQEVLRAPMKKLEAAAPAEMFIIKLTPSSDAATLTLAWGDRAWSLDVAAAK